MKATLLLIFSILSISLFGQINLDSGLVAFYPFEGNTIDQSINSIAGIPSNIAYGTGVYGTPNSSVIFDGTDSSYVDCGIDNRGINDTITISAFVRTTFTGIGDIVSKYDPGNDHGYHFQLSLGKIRFAGRDGSGAYRSTGFSMTSINDSAWHHIIGQIFGNTWVIYIDCVAEGAQSASSPSPDVSSNANLGIGKDVFNDQKYLDCEVDEVRIYDRLLTTDEMDSLCATAVFASYENQEIKSTHIQIYPNPTQDRIAIAVDQSLENSRVDIFDLSGKLVHSEIVHFSTAIINVNHLNPGNYIIRITNHDFVWNSKFSKI